MSLRIKGIDVMKRNLRLKVNSMSKGAYKGMVMVMAEYERDVKTVTPVDTGFLINSYSRKVKRSRSEIVGILVNTAAYAWWVHEMPPETNFQKQGATNRFMANPLMAMSQRRIQRILASAIRQETK